MGMGITAVKLTALGRPQLLVSNFIFTADFNCSSVNLTAIK